LDWIGSDITVIYGHDMISMLLLCKVNRGRSVM